MRQQRLEAGGAEAIVRRRRREEGGWGVVEACFVRSGTIARMQRAPCSERTRVHDGVSCGWLFRRRSGSESLQATAAASIL